MPDPSVGQSEQGEDRQQGEDRHYDWAGDPTAQDVIDALRVALMAQKDPAEAIKVVACLVEFAPETDGSRGLDLLLRLISEATLKVSLTNA